MAESVAMAATSSKPGRQRKWLYTKPLHSVRKDFSVHLSRELRKQIGRRNLEARKGDTAKVLRGSKKFAGRQGKITEVMTGKRMVLIEGIVRKKIDGTEKQVPFRPSNLLLVAIDEKDERRLSKKNRKGPLAGKQRAKEAEGNATDKK
ncbi:MAG: 50S ribosomal protein L24 [Candidatus Diapherotrites archaeon]|uniref:Large ribosomal subunit protein uL24 n=1 Tax=Candidatus Iainarchaeum sp. TaxID=3101447 RepID=A0A8T3YHX2_9ARCH|nr:50S ribosomal protein L24 [Candidatus Diapherotrites archaeon]